MRLGTKRPDFVSIGLVDKYSKARWADLAAVLFRQLYGDEMADRESYLEGRMKEEIKLYEMRN